MIAANLRWLNCSAISLVPCTPAKACLAPGKWAACVLHALIIILTYWSFLWISSSLWVCLFYWKALQWFTMKVIFLVSLLQKSNKYKSNAIWVLQTLSFHFILFVSFTSLFPLNLKWKSSFPECKAGWSLSQNTQGCSAVLVPVMLGTSAYSGQNSGCLIRLHQSTLNFGLLGKICTLTNWKLMDVHMCKYRAIEAFFGAMYIQNSQIHSHPYTCFLNLNL